MEENTERKLYSPPEFYVLDFKETKSGEAPDEAEDFDLNTHYDSAYA